MSTGTSPGDDTANDRWVARSIHARAVGVNVSHSTITAASSRVARRQTAGHCSSVGAGVTRKRNAGSSATASARRRMRSRPDTRRSTGSSPSPVSSTASTSTSSRSIAVAPTGTSSSWPGTPSRSQTTAGSRRAICRAHGSDGSGGRSSAARWRRLSGASARTRRGRAPGRGRASRPWATAGSRRLGCRRAAADGGCRPRRRTRWRTPRPRPATAAPSGRSRRTVTRCPAR